MELYLTDLIDIDTLRSMEEAFTALTGMACVTTDAQGKPLVESSLGNRFCYDIIRSTPAGCAGCAESDRYGADAALRSGIATSYYCHAGMVDFSVPIMVKDEVIGSFIGGQVMAHPPVEAQMRQLAENIGVDPDLLWEAAQQAKVDSKENIDKAVDALHRLSGIISQMAYDRYREQQINHEIEAAGRTKSDFLANMSHEIRTPMNAVIGMAEMALREDLPPAARGYINQIKSSGRALLSIINDILDFSKIDSGKMEIIPVEYEPLSMFNDVANILMTRLRDKYSVELQLQADPNFPAKLYGDNQRIRQVLINLANNAVKFTEHGRVKISVGFEDIDEDHILVKVSVEDTGIGIKKEDLSKLFESFQQVDSKRNRNVEGTGLGLAISRQLITLMGGTIGVDSEYGKGSTFYFSLPQKVIDRKPAIRVRDAENVCAVACIANRFLARQLFSDTNRMGVHASALSSLDNLEMSLRFNGPHMEGKDVYLFFEEGEDRELVDRVLDRYPDFCGVVITGYFSDLKPWRKNVRIMKKPLSTMSLALILSGETVLGDSNDDSADADFDFTAPEANVLIVDDNSVNLTVAEGLLEPLNMKIYSATSGKMALDMLDNTKFDLIFMDHMMPELDGVETTRIIRRLHPEYNGVPIVALTANAVEGTREMFLSEGMNDFVPKPIEVRVLVNKVKQWLPESKIVRGIAGQTAKKNVPPSEELVIADLDTATALRMLGNDKLYMKMLKEYWRTIRAKHDRIYALQQAGDIPGYTIEVHALKSASRQIGAMELSRMAADLEKAGHDNNAMFIGLNTEAMLERYIGYEELLRPFCEEPKEEQAAEAPKQGIDADTLHGYLNDMTAAADELDMDRMEEVMTQLEGYSYDEVESQMLVSLREAVDQIDVDTIAMIVGAWDEKER